MLNDVSGIPTQPVPFVKVNLKLSRGLVRVARTKSPKMQEAKMQNGDAVSVLDFYFQVVMQCQSLATPPI